MTNLMGVPVYEGKVRPEWIDFNDHMNVAYYVHAFDLGIDALWTQFGITEAYIAETRGSTFGVECHVRYLSELNLDDPYIVTAQVLGYDEKRIHQFQRMYHGSTGDLAATAEWMNLHVDLDARRVTPWPAHILAAIAAFADAQDDQSRPEAAGSQMTIRQPLYTL
jgi:acyl-CoA thioester hydrolase